MNQILIEQGRLVCPSQNLDEIGNIYIENEKIIGLGKQAPKNFNPVKTIKANGCWVLPGLIDLAANLREPGFEQKGSILSETKAAAKGGITSLCCLPNTNPVIDTPSVIELISKRASDASTKVYPVAAAIKSLTSQQLSEMAALKSAGAIGVSNAGVDITDTALLKRLFQYAATFDLTFFYTACDHYLSQNGVIHDGQVAAKLGLKGIPSSAETIAIAKALMLQTETGVKLHFCRLSTKESVRLIEQAQKNGFNVTADVVIHQLLYTENEVNNYNSDYYVLPPLRTEEDRRALITGVKSGVIQAICSDHAPHENTAKLEPFANTEPGISNIEYFLNLLYQIHLNDQVEFKPLLAAATNQPAELINKPGGTLELNNPADITIFNPEGSLNINQENMLSSGKNSPLLNQSLPGCVEWTLMDGKITYARS